MEVFRRMQRLLPQELESTTTTCPAANDVLRRFSRDTEWLVAGLLGVLFFAALAFAVLVPERHPTTADLPNEASQAKSGSPLNADAATLFSIVDLNAKRSTSETISGTTRVDHGLSEAKVAAASSSLPILVWGAEIGSETTRATAQANGSKWSPTYRQDSARVIRAKIPPERDRSSGRLKAVDVKARLIALWHQSLLRSEKPQRWALFSNLNRRKKVAYTAARGN
jgi:hypothetical protein